MTSDVQIELFLAELAKDDEMQQRLQDDDQQYEAMYLEPLDFNELPF
ncbi:hypothetical protein [Moraxella porci]|nr:hypothetical protein [Moraxella porci]MDH2272967.1 hypothetical protein [Moraxella porci]